MKGDPTSGALWGDGELEKAILGGCLMRPRLIQALPLEVGDFYSLPCATVFEAMLELSTAGVGVDELTVANLLKRKGRLDAVGGEPFLAELVLLVPTAENVMHHAGLVREHAVTRRVMQAIATVQDAHTKGVGAGRLHGDELLAFASDQLAHVRSARIETGVPMGQAMRDEDELVRADMRRKELGESVYVGVPTGFRDIDQRVGGLPRGVVTIGAGRQGNGKTTVADNLCDNAEDAGYEALYCSLEDNVQAFAQRGIGRHASINTEAIRTREFTRETVARYMERASWGFGRRRRLLPCGGMSARDIARAARLHKLEHGRLDLLVVDYLQRLEYPDRLDEREGINWNLKILVTLAQQENMAVLLMSQLSREVERRAVEKGSEGRPTVLDLKGSGNIEDQGKLIFLIYRPGLYLTDDVMSARGYDSTRLELIFVKNHQGVPHFNVPLYYDAPTSLIANSAIDAGARRLRRPMVERPEVH